MSDAPPLLTIRDLRFAYAGGAPVLDVAAFDLAPGERVFLRGPSGCGKSTLLGLIAGVLSPGSGQLSVLGRDMAALSGAARDALRAEHLGVIFQMFNLLPYLSLLDNVVLPCRFSPARGTRAAERSGSVAGEAERLLEHLGLGAEAKAGTPVQSLSVGQQQRVAAARALIGGPALILADEPTSALDTDARDAFLSLLISEAEAHGSGLIFVSHDAGLAGHFTRSEDLRALNRAPIGQGVEAGP